MMNKSNKYSSASPLVVKILCDCSGSMGEEANEHNKYGKNKALIVEEVVNTTLFNLYRSGVKINTIKSKAFVSVSGYNEILQGEPKVFDLMTLKEDTPASLQHQKFRPIGKIRKYVTTEMIGQEGKEGVEIPKFIQIVNPAGKTPMAFAFRTAAYDLAEFDKTALEQIQDENLSNSGIDGMCNAIIIHVTDGRYDSSLCGVGSDFSAVDLDEIRAAVDEIRYAHYKYIRSVTILNIVITTEDVKEVIFPNVQPRSADPFLEMFWDLSSELTDVQLETATKYYEFRDRIQGARSFAYGVNVSSPGSVHMLERIFEVGTETTPSITGKRHLRME